MSVLLKPLRSWLRSSALSMDRSAATSSGDSRAASRSTCKQARHYKSQRPQSLSQIVDLRILAKQVRIVALLCSCMTAVAPALLGFSYMFASSDLIRVPAVLFVQEEVKALADQAMHTWKLPAMRCAVLSSNRSAL